jgi:hypothetical protein
MYLGLIWGADTYQCDEALLPEGSKFSPTQLHGPAEQNRDLPSRKGPGTTQACDPNALRKLKHATASPIEHCGVWLQVRTKLADRLARFWSRFITSVLELVSLSSTRWRNCDLLPGSGTRWYSSADVKPREAKLGRPGPGMTSGWTAMATLTTQRA